MQDFDPNHIDTPVLARIGQKIVIFNDKNEVLFLRRSQKCTRAGGWDFPGGGIELGEDPTQAIIRETLEETLLVTTNIEPIHLESSVDNHGNFTIMVGYMTKIPSLTPSLSWEHDAHQWLNADEALKVELPRIHRKFLEKALEKSKREI